MKVIAPDGSEWKVGRRWLPWRARLRDTGGPDIGDFFAFDDLAGLAVGIAVVLLTLVVILLLPFLVLIVELALLLVLGVVTFFSRVVLRRPWTVQARTEGTLREWKVPGFRNAGDKVQEVAAAIASGAEVVDGQQIAGREGLQVAPPGVG